MAHHLSELPSGQALSLVSALSNAENHELHIHAMRAKDEALASQASYQELVVQLARILVHGSDPSMLERMDPQQLQVWEANDASGYQKLRQYPQGTLLHLAQMSGFILKDALLRPPIVQDRPVLLSTVHALPIRQLLLLALQSPVKQVRNVASSVISMVSVSHNAVQPQLHISSWDTLVSDLQQCLQDPKSLEGGLLTLQKLLEDGPSQIPEVDLDAAIPIWISLLCSQPRPELLALLELCIPNLPSALVAHWNDYLQAVAAAPFPGPVCRTLSVVLQYKAETIESTILQYVFNTTQHADPKIAIEATEFWLTYATLDDDRVPTSLVEMIQVVLPQLIPVLLARMEYDLDRRQQLKAEQQQQQDIQPVFHKSKASRLSGDHDDGSIGEGDDGEGDNDDDDGEWNLRKCAAASLDALATVYGGTVVLPILLPAIEQGLTEADPWRQESCILALGAVAEGCQEEMRPFLGRVFPYLMKLLVEPSIFPVKAIAAWTIGQYAYWVVEQAQNGLDTALVAQAAEALLNCLNDTSPRVQHAGCSAFGYVVEAGSEFLSPYLETILQALGTALTRLQSRSLLCVLDVIGIIAEHCGPSIAEGSLLAVFVVPMLSIWDTVAKKDPRDKMLLPLMESLACVAVAAGMNFQPYALECFDKAMCIIETVTLLLTSVGDLPSIDELDPIVCATDMLDGLVEGLGENFTGLLASSTRYGPQFLNMLVSLCEHEAASVRTSAFALLGDLTIHSTPVVVPGLPRLLNAAVQSMDPIQPATATNAVWAMGEICCRCDSNSNILEPYENDLLQNLMALVVGNGAVSEGATIVGDDRRGTTVPGLSMNAASCLGRLAKIRTDFVASNVHRFLLGWCESMAKITDESERRDAFQGLVQVLYVNPQAIQNAAVRIADSINSIMFAIVSWHLPSSLPEKSTDVLYSSSYQFQPFPANERELGQALVGLVQGMKQTVDAQTWRVVETNMPVNVRKLMREVYGL